MTTLEALRHGREAFARRAWSEAYAALRAADGEGALHPADVEHLAAAAHLVGHVEEAQDVLGRAHQAWLDAGEPGRAGRCACWLAIELYWGGKQAHSSGWLARARRALEQAPADCVEYGYLILPTAMRLVNEGDIKAAFAAFSEADAIGTRYADADVMALARMGRGRTLIGLGQPVAGVGLLDEVMLAVTTGEVSPIIVGIVYCSVIDACQEIFDLARAQEWTGALEAWCESEPDVVPYRGVCLVHRAELLRLHGDWPDALDQANRACEWLARPPAQRALGAAFYQVGELYRLRGEAVKAEEAYRRASEHGRAPQPGLALLRLGQGDTASALAAVVAALEGTRDRRRRAQLLAATAEIALACGEVSQAAAAVAELSALGEQLDAPFLRALSAHWEGARLLAEGHARQALVSLRLASAAWHELPAPYECARAGLLIAEAARQLGDRDSASLETDAARATLVSLGAIAELARLDRGATAARDATPLLTSREVQVLRLVATGMTNRAIADALAISEKTVARHISNIFTKLDLSSRAAATAYAFHHALVPRPA